MKGFTPLTRKTDPPKKKYPPHYTEEDIQFLKDQNEDIVREEDKPTGQDIVKPKESQIKDLQNDIKILKERNNPGDDSRIKKLEAEINRLKS